MVKTLDMVVIYGLYRVCVCTYIYIYIHIPAPPNYPFRNHKHNLIEVVIRPLIEIH